MAKCRLKCNVLIDGKLLKRGEIVDDAELTPLFRGEQYVDHQDLAGREGKVMLLHGLQFTVDQVVQGQLSSFPCQLTMGELIDLETIPERQRQDLREGVDYVTEWTEEQRQKLRHEETQRDLKYFQPSDKLEVYDV
jgi:hypothetical protein